MSNIKWNQKYVCMYGCVYAHAYVYIAVIITEEVMNVKGSIRIQEETAMEKEG